jgi:hypothetical protein
MVLAIVLGVKKMKTGLEQNWCNKCYLILNRL